MTLKELSSVLLEAGIPVAHYKTRLTERPYIIYREFSTSYNFASGNAWREVEAVGVDHYTEKEFDETLVKLKKALLKRKINFTTATIWDEENEIIQTSFDFSISRELEVGE